MSKLQVGKTSRNKGESSKALFGAGKLAPNKPKEIIDLLEKIKNSRTVTGPTDERLSVILELKEIAGQALTLLKQPTKQYLPSELIKDNNFVCQNCHHIHEMGGYKVVKQQPTAGEWTKACRGMVEGIDRVIHPKSIPYESARDRLIEACDRLDRAEAENKELLELCEEFMEIADDGSARFDDPEPGSIYLRAEAVITRAKKE